MRDLPQDDDVLSVMGSLWAVDHGLQAVSKRMLRTIGVTGPQRTVLRMVGREEGISPGDLARRIHDHPSTITGVLRRLEERGLVSRSPDLRDARRSHLHLTEAGRELNAMREGTVESAVRATLARLPEGDLDRAMEMLRVLTEELANISDPEE